MIGMRETWSHPWQDLQKRLADSYVTGPGYPTRQPVARQPVPATNSWLVRARRATFEAIHAHG